MLQARCVALVDALPKELRGEFRDLLTHAMVSTMGAEDMLRQDDQRAATLLLQTGNARLKLLIEAIDRLAGRPA